MPRLTAVHVELSEIAGGSFVKGSAEEGEASFVENGRDKFSRVCVTAKVVERHWGPAGEATVVVEDNTGQLPAAAGTKAAQGCLQAVNKGDLVLIIGKMRERQERYISAETARKLPQEAWLDLHASRVELRRAKTGK